MNAARLRKGILGSQEIISLPKNWALQGKDLLESSLKSISLTRRCGFALLMYGFGSKKALVEDFATRSLTEYSVVVNGYLQSINLKQVVITLAELLWDQLKLRRKTTSGSLSKSQQSFNTRSMDDLAFLDKPDDLKDDVLFASLYTVLMVLGYVILIANNILHALLLVLMFVWLLPLTMSILLFVSVC
ncbi:hypothetical protein K7X08_028719 [Anisodus acutangulus]|uniref:Origin recognition complex subunit 2 n=1 Tax=Anisodus acutangulus TaxID=402998 RepID=A0A9Q1L104_9SOLA|nr:hypothetical protein K7X08_028719 [Anisodus acutangulus]